MGSNTGGRVPLQAYCSATLKDWAKDYARRQGKPLSDMIIDLLLEAKKFDDFEQATHKDAATADWEMLAVTAKSPDEP